MSFTDWPFYLASMLLVFGLAAWTAWKYEEERGTLVWVIFAIGFNWCAGRAFVLMTEDSAPWQFNIFIDSMAAFAILWPPSSRWQSIIACFYFAQLAFHAVYGSEKLLNLSIGEVLYYKTITWIALAQLIAVGVWCGGRWLRNHVHHFRYFGYALDRVTGAANMDEQT